MRDREMRGVDCALHKFVLCCVYTCSSALKCFDESTPVASKFISRTKRAAFIPAHGQYSYNIHNDLATLPPLRKEGNT